MCSAVSEPDVDIDDVDMKPAEARRFLSTAPVRLVQSPSGVGYPAPQIFHDGKWKDLMRGDYCGEVVSRLWDGKTEQEWRQHYIESVLVGAWVDDATFIVIDAASDG